MVMKATDIVAVKAVYPGRFKALWLVCVIACMMAMSGAVRAARVGRELSLGIPGNMPLADLQDGRVVGVIAEATVMALERMGWRAQPRLLPFKRMCKCCERVRSVFVG